MIILLLFLIIIATIVFFINGKKQKSDTLNLCGTIGFSVSILLIFVAVSCTNNVLASRYIDEKIAMYKEENLKIEQQIDTVVRNYMQFEYDTYAELKIDDKSDAIALVSLYPNLKSDELIKTQIELYIKNNQKIKELKEQRLTITKDRWWLYFGT